MTGRTLAAVYVVLAAIVLAAMPAWRWMVGDGPARPEVRAMTPEAFGDRVAEQIAAYQVGETEQGVPVVHPPPGDVWLMATRFSFSPVLELEVGRTYRLHVAGTDVLHGFWFPLAEVDLLLPPGQVSTLTLTPTIPGTFAMQCSENCGIGHNRMKGAIRVVPAQD